MVRRTSSWRARSFFPPPPPSPGTRRQPGPGLEYIRSNYTKFEYQIPMRDGVKLFTSVYVPKDASQPWPIMLQRTPYGVAPYGADTYRGTLGPSDLFAKEGFIFAYQDVRGRGQSEGVFDDPPAHKLRFSGPTDADESTDSYDTIDWLVKNIPNNNGRVGTWGISYPGFFPPSPSSTPIPPSKPPPRKRPWPTSATAMTPIITAPSSWPRILIFTSASNPNQPRPLWPRRRRPRARPPHRRPRFSMGTPDEYDFFLRLGTLADAEERYFKHQNEFWTTLVKHDSYDQFWSSRALAANAPPHRRRPGRGRLV